jgi:HSP20 family molecular chaperone IbpA
MPVKLFAATLDEFGRTFDELFDDLLIQRWRLTPIVTESEHAIVRDYDDHYEVMFAAGGIDPDAVEIEVGERRLTVRIANEASGTRERSFSFAESVEREAVTAKAAGETLLIVLPKIRRARRVRVAQS